MAEIIALSEAFKVRDWEQVRKLLNENKYSDPQLWFYIYNISVPEDIAALAISMYRGPLFTRDQEKAIIVRELALFGHIDRLRLFLSRGLTPQIRDDNHDTVLQTTQSFEVVELFVKAGACLRVCCRALDRKILWKNNYRILAYLLQHGAIYDVWLRRGLYPYEPLLRKVELLLIVVSPFHVVRIGRHSPLRCLPADIVRLLGKMLFPLITYHNNDEPNTT